MPKPRFTKAAETPIEHLAVRVRNYMHMPNPDILHAVVGTVAANMIEGYPVWLMILGPPGSGKSEWLDSLRQIPGMNEAASISGEAAFLSATPARERSDKASGGILREVGAHGGLVINDFTSVLSLREDVLKQVMTVFRETYIGRWTRDVGAEGGMKINWEGKVAYIAGCTGAIDQYHQIASALGERWLYYRLDEEDGFQKSMQLLGTGRPEGWKTDFAALIAGFIEGQDLRFGEQKPKRPFTDYEKVRIIDMARIAVRCRSTVSRDRFTKEVVGARETENEMRVTGALGQLLIALEFIGVKEEDRWRLLGKISLDSMPKLRQLVVMAAWKAKDQGVTLSQLKSEIGASLPTITRTVEDLQIHGVIAPAREDDTKTRVRLSEWAAEEIRKAWKGLSL